MEPTTAPPAAIRTIAAGGNPPWEHTAQHPKHGSLTFRARLPLAMDSLKHSIEMDNQLSSARSHVSIQTRILAAAIAGMTVPEDNPPGKGLMMDLPIIDTITEPTETGERTTHVYYNPEAEADPGWLTDVWMEFSQWRNSLLTDEAVSAVGESSGAPSTSSGASSAPSAGPTAPPSQIPAS